MNPIEAAVLRTVLYADIFSFPMTVEEIHHFLIHDEPVTLDVVRDTLDQSPSLKQLLYIERGYVIYGQQTTLIELRTAREQASARLWPSACYYGVWLSRLPFIRMVALTGALAMRNAAHGDDDLDYLVITAPGRVWLARAFAILLVRIARLRGITVCPNYVLSEENLEQERHDIFLAHEVTQMVPLYGMGVYERLRSVNAWTFDSLPNARAPFYPEKEYIPRSGWRMLKEASEWLLGGWLGDRLEAWEYRRKLRRFTPDMHIPDSSARLDETQVKGHFNDHGHPALRRYQERLRQCGLLEEASISKAGD